MPSPSDLPRPVARLAVSGAAVLLAGLVTAGVLQGPPAARPVPVAAPTPSASPSLAPPSPAPPAVVPLAVRPAAAPAPAFDPGDPATWSSQQLAAQAVVSCVQSNDPGQLTAHAAAGLGGLVVLGRPTDGAALTATLAAARGAAPHGIAPVLSSDEEGGLVQRLRGVLGALPTAREMGGWPDERIEQTAFDYGSRMRALGYAMALSPVADVAVPGYYIDDTRRAFSADPGRVAAAASAWARGLGRAGVVAAVKHWPGHGEAGDSHAVAPVVPPLPVLQGRDLPPFDAVLQTGSGIIMVGHLQSEGLTDPGLPATLSPSALRVLRERAGAGTVLLTDSLSMGAATAAVGLAPRDAAVRALQAGADWAMVCVDALGAVDAVRAALDAGAWPRDAAVASVRRVLALKQRLGLLAVPLVTAPPAGALEAAVQEAGVVRLLGTAGDPDGPPLVRVLVGGAAAGEVATDAATGRFEIAAPAAAGTEVCAEAVGTGPGRPVLLGCTTAV